MVALPEVWYGSGGPPGGPRLCLKSLSEVREGSKFPPRGPGVVGRPSRMSGRSREALPEVRDGLEALLEVRDRSKGPPEGPGQV